MQVTREVKTHQCPPAEPNRCHWWCILETTDFRVEIYPDTAKTRTGQKCQVLWMARRIAPLMGSPRFLKRHDKEYGVWEDGWEKRMHEYHLVGPSPDYISYVRKSRKRNRPGFITDEMIDIHVIYLRSWQQATDMTRRMANLIAETLRG